MSDEEKRGLRQAAKQNTECRDAADDPQPRRILSRDELPKFAVHNAGRMRGTLRRMDMYEEWLDEKYPPIKQDAESPDAADEQHNDEN